MDATRPSARDHNQAEGASFHPSRGGFDRRRPHFSRGRGAGRGRLRFEHRGHHDTSKVSHSDHSHSETFECPVAVVDGGLPEQAEINDEENVLPSTSQATRTYETSNNDHRFMNKMRPRESQRTGLEFGQNDRRRYQNRSNQTVAGASNISQNKLQKYKRNELSENQVESLNAASHTIHNIVPRRFMRDRNLPVNKESNQPESADVAQSDISENRFKSNTFECMICCDTIFRTNPIWYCTDCYNIFHMKCAIEWCNKSLKSRDEAIAQAQFPSLGDSNGSNNTNRSDGITNARSYPDYRNERKKSVEWPCPTCRKVLHSRPGKYKCFCGKVVQPEVYRHSTPHSCGQLCGRKRASTGCPHLCDSICHPGRCNPCQLTTQKSCHCGKLMKEVKCNAQVGSCNEVCGKTLSCDRHYCQKICHEGVCSSCDVILTVKCYCGSKEVLKRCGDNKLGSGQSSKVENSFSCDKICEKLLDCGKHRCSLPCHPGPDCPSCKLLSKNLKTCPCGSTSIAKNVLEARKFCTDPLPTCESKCRCRLICGPDKNNHRCQKKCHIGSCPPCKLKSAVKCECLMSSRHIDCALMFEKILDANQEVTGFKQVKYTFRCETRCNLVKNCDKHRCLEKCCDALWNPTSRNHICTQICNKKLPCGSHNCQEICHAGLCGDCTNIGWTELRCHCGGSVMYPPIPCGAQPPACHRPCRRAHICGHPVKHECHDDTEKCAPCTVFVKKSCFCGADSKDSVYCYLSGYSCGRVCKKKLSCRQHTCKRICHDGPCEIPNERGVIVCSQPCSVLRFVCKHPCNLPCHGKTFCPATDCNRAVEIGCECGSRKERIECHKLSRDSDNRNKMAMLSMNRPDQDSVVIDLSKKLPASSSIATTSEADGMVTLAETTKKLDCVETCAIYKRNKALAEALDIVKPELKPANIFGQDPLKLLKEATAHDYKYVAGTYDALTKLIKSVKESDRRFTFLKFPSTDKLRREVIHELAYHFNCTSESRDDEFEKFVIVRASRNKSAVPDFTIEQLLPVDD